MLETERLYLKPFMQHDLDETIPMFQDHDFMVFSPNGTLNIEDATCRFSEILEHYNQYGFGKMAIISKETHKIIGYCGFEMCNVNGSEEAELGFRLIKTERNKGYIVEATVKLLADVKNRGFKHVIAFSEETNYPAHNLLKKLGFSKTETSHFFNMDVVFFKKTF